MSKKAYSNLGFSLLLVVAGAVWAGERFNLPWATDLALALVGVAAIVGGIRILIRGEAIEGRQQVLNPRAVVRYRGLPARLMGVLVALIGAIILVLSMVDLTYPGGAEDLLASLLDTSAGSAGSALLIGFAGLFVLGFGLVRLLAGSGAATGYHSRTVEWSIRIGGAFSALVGVILLALAVALFFSPGAVMGLIDQIVVVAKKWLLNGQ